MSNFIFNDPNFNPNLFDPIRFKQMSAMAKERHEKMLADGLKQMKFPRAMLPSDIEALITEVNQRVKLVAQYANLIDAEVKASGKDHNKAMLMADLQKKFVENFSHYNKDQLLVVLTKFFTEMVMQEIV